MGIRNMGLKIGSLVRLFAVIGFLALIPAAALAQSSLVQTRITQKIDESQRTVLHGNVHPLARPEFDRGAAPADLPMERMLLVLRRSPAQEAAVEKLIAEQQDRSSPNYHKWLTPQEFGRQFGPSDQDIATVRTWLESHGFMVNGVANGRQTIEFSGTASQVAEAFQAPIHSFLVNGEQHWANASDPSIPKALAPVVAGVASLHSFAPQPMSHFRRLPERAAGPASDAALKRQVSIGTAAPCGLAFFTSVNNVDQCFGLGPADFATIYNILPLWNEGIDGTGETIGIVADSNINVNDVSDFRSIFGLPLNPPVVTVNGSDPGKNGDEVEAILDVEWSGSVAKNATINLVVSKGTNSTPGVNLSATDIVDNKLANIMSLSFGECEIGLGTSGNTFFNNTYSQAATEGITVVVSSGDQGSAGCEPPPPSPKHPAVKPATDGLAVNGIASTPFNTAVGGTEFDDLSNPTQFWNTTNAANTLASAKGYVPERTYNDSCADPIVFTSFLFPNAQQACNDNTNVGPDNFIIVSGGGGGVSSCITDANLPTSCSGGYAKPSWQAALTPADGARDLPDISLFAGDGTISGSFYVLCERDLNGNGSNTPCNLTTGAFLEAGGTSISTQVFAGIAALLNQKYEDKQGLINPALYTLAAANGHTCTSAANPAGSCMFYDVVNGNISMPCQSTTFNCPANGSPNNILPGYNAAAGYDLATGLGSVNVANLVNASNTWASTTSGNDFSIAAGAPTQVSSPGGTATVQITVTANGTFNGAVTFACSQLPALTTCSGPMVNGSGQSTIMFQTTAASGAAPSVRVAPPNSRLPLAPIGAISLGLILLACRKENRRRSAVLAFVVLGVVFASAGCGGGNNPGGNQNPGTPVGTTNVVVTATSGAIQRSVAVTLVVN